MQQQPADLQQNFTGPTGDSGKEGRACHAGKARAKAALDAMVTDEACSSRLSDDPGSELADRLHLAGINDDRQRDDNVSPGAVAPVAHRARLHQQHHCSSFPLLLGRPEARAGRNLPGQGKYGSYSPVATPAIRC